MLAFHAWQRKGGYRFEAYEEHIKAGEYSDDTQLLIATARSILRGKNWAFTLSAHELPLWLLCERGGGGATKRAARTWLSGGRPWKQPNKQLQSYFNAGGNGVAMRVLPHVLKPGQTWEELMRDVMRNGILTHGHPRALLGAIVYAYAAWSIIHTSLPLPLGGVIQELLDNRTQWEILPSNMESSTSDWLDAANQAFPHGYEVEWKCTVQEVCDGLTMIHKAIHEQGALLYDQPILDHLGCFGRTRGSGIVAALAVCYLFSVYVSDPVTGLRTIAFARSADTDTLASMLAGLFGLVHGSTWIPTTLQHVQDHTLIADIADRLTRLRSQGEAESIPRWSEQHTRQVLETLQAHQNTALSIGILGHARVISHRTLKPLTRNVLRADEWCLHTDAGQTIYVSQTRQASSSKNTQDTRINQEIDGESVEIALQILRKILHSSAESRESLYTIIADQWSNLTDANPQFIVSRLEQFLHVVHEHVVHEDDVH